MWYRAVLMILAGLFGGFLFLMLVLGDWWHFSSLGASASRYGCRVATMEDRLPLVSAAAMPARFGPGGQLRLPNGTARLFQDEHRLVVRPQRRLRTAWPMKGSIEWSGEGDGSTWTCHKLIPWSSAILTLVWFLTVGIGTLTFVVLYLTDGGLASLSGIMMGLGILGIGLLVMAFGLVTVAFAYRLEDQRLAQAYQDLREALGRDSAPSS